MHVSTRKAAALLQLPLHVSYYSIFNYFVAGSEGIKECVSGMNAPAVDIHLCCFVKSIFHEFLKKCNSFFDLAHIYTYGGVSELPRRWNRGDEYLGTYLFDSYEVTFVKSKF